MRTTPPLSSVELTVKQINLDGFSEIGISAMQFAFNKFIAKEMNEEEASQRRKDISNLFGGEKVFPSSKLIIDRPTFRRRFAGDRTLTRGNYYTIAQDHEGHDGTTLYHELLAYYEPKEPGWVGVFDLSIAEHREVVLSRAEPVLKARLHDFDLDGPSIVIVFLPLNGHPHPFAARYTDKAAPFFVSIPTIVKHMHVDSIVDIRSPEVASWFTREMTRWRVVLDGKEQDFVPVKPPLTKFRDLIPTLLEQSHGSDDRALTTSAAIRLRELGIKGLIFPSARVDSVLKVNQGQILESIGWNFVDYRGSGKPQVSFVVDMDSKWPVKVGWQRMAYEDVHIEYSESGASKGSWSVSGLAAWQEAWFRVQTVHSVLEAKDPELYKEIGPNLSSLWNLAKSSAWLLQVSDIIFGALQATEEDLSDVEELAQKCEDLNLEEIADSLRKLVTAGIDELSMSNDKGTHDNLWHPTRY
jgi:hypothetical protein